MNYEQLVKEIEAEIKWLQTVLVTLAETHRNVLGGVSEGEEVVRGHLTHTGTSERTPGTRKRGSTKGRTMPVYTDAQRLEAVRLVRGGLSVGKAAKQIGATFFTVRSWVRSGRWEPQTATVHTQKKAGIDLGDYYFDSKTKKKRVSVVKKAPAKKKSTKRPARRQ